MLGKKLFTTALAGLVWSVLVVGTFTALACGARVHGQSPSKDVIRLPSIKQDAIPAPMPVSVDSTVKLSPDVIYVVESDVECLVWLSRGGSVKVTKESGPLRFRGKFADGGGATETRTYTGKFLYLFDAIKNGEDELIISPVGAKNESESKRVTFQVGQLPQPPPKPDDPIVPKPKPVVTSFRVIGIYDTAATMTAVQTSVLYGNQVEDWLTANCTGGKDGWRRRGKDADGSDDKAFASLWSAVKGETIKAPCWAVQVNDKVELIPFEANQAEQVKKFAEYKGGK